MSTKPPAPARPKRSKRSKPTGAKAGARPAEAPAIAAGATAVERKALADSIRAFAKASYPATELRHVTCPCGGDRFEVEADDDVGVARRRCVACRAEHLIGDSADQWDEATPEPCGCTCDAGVFQLAVGFALRRDRQDLHWLYVGLRCVACGLAGVYTDWKIDYGPSLHLIERA